MAKIVVKNCTLTIWTTHQMDDSDNYTLRISDKDGVLYEECSEIIWKCIGDYVGTWKKRLASQEDEKERGLMAAETIMFQALRKKAE